MRPAESPDAFSSLTLRGPLVALADMSPKSRFISRFFFLTCSAILLQAGCRTNPKSSTAVTAPTELRLASIFSHNMVLQQGASVPVWGWADDGEIITVQFADQKVTTTAKGGKWMARLNNLKYGAPGTLTVSGSKTLVFTNVVVGEVWVCSGQSNMEFALRNSYQSTNDIAISANPNLRLFTVQKLKANAPTNNVRGSWAEAGPTTTPGFSAVAYYFGRDLQKALGVPVGLIHTSWGGSPAEAWMSEQVLAGNPRYKTEILDAYLKQSESYQKTLAQFEKDQAEANAANKPFTRNRPNPGWKPSELYNGMIAPIISYGIKGAIWYQGESNAGKAEQYRSLFADMIRNWRRDWAQGGFTFLTVQLAPYMKIKPEPAESTWAELREAQNLTIKTLPKAGTVSITDVGEENDIHPKKKEPVGVRLALAARGITYGHKIVYSGPTYKSVEFENGSARISFDHVGTGLETHGLAGQTNWMGWNTVTGDLTKETYLLKGFSIAGADRKFVWADAQIVGDQVVVSSAAVSDPVAVRFGWADYPVVNLWNKDGIPATPFRTDNFPMITAPKK